MEKENICSVMRLNRVVYLPDEILGEKKLHFQMLFGHSMVDYLKEYAQKQYTECRI